MTRRQLWTGLIATRAAVVIFMVPFVFIATMAVKDKAQASRLDFTWPQQFLFWQNFTEVLSTRNYQLLLGFFQFQHHHRRRGFHADPVWGGGGLCAAKAAFEVEQGDLWLRFGRVDHSARSRANDLGDAGLVHVQDDL